MLIAMGGGGLIASPEVVIEVHLKDWNIPIIWIKINIAAIKTPKFIPCYKNGNVQTAEREWVDGRLGMKRWIAEYTRVDIFCNDDDDWCLGCSGM